MVQYPLLNIEFPANAVLFYNFIVSIQNFKLIPSGPMNNNLFIYSAGNLSPSNSFQNMGYGNDTFMMNIGSFPSYVLIYASLTIVTIFMKLFQ